MNGFFSVAIVNTLTIYIVLTNPLDNDIENHYHSIEPNNCMEQYLVVYKHKMNRRKIK